MVRVVTMMRALGERCVCSEQLCVVQGRGGKLAPHGPRDLHHFLEHVRVVVARAQRGNRHDLGDGAEATHLWVDQATHVGQALRGVAHGVRHLGHTQQAG